VRAWLGSMAQAYAARRRSSIDALIQDIDSARSQAHRASRLSPDQSYLPIVPPTNPGIFEGDPRLGETYDTHSSSHLRFRPPERIRITAPFIQE
jgi:hypothetical protein